MDDDVRTGPDRLGPVALARVLETAPDGLAVAERGSGERLYVNPAGRGLLADAADRGGAGHAEGAPCRSCDAFDARASGEVTTTSHHGRQLERMTVPVEDGSRALAVTWFRDVTAVRQRERHLAAFSRTAASVAFAGPLSTVLDRLAAEVRDATGMLACTFLLMDEDGRLRQTGMTDQGYPGVEDYADRIEACRRLGAPLLSATAFRDRRPLVAHGWRERTLADARFRPVHAIALHAGWSAMATVPVVSRGQVIGVFNGFFRTDADPVDEDLPFLSAIADQAAVAIENARLLGAVETKVALEERHLLARELHDSVSQALFSLTLQARALEIGMASGRLDERSVNDGLVEVRRLTEGALAEMRALIFQLRPAALREEGLFSAVRKHASAVAAREGIAVDVVGPPSGPDLDPAVEEQVLRVVQEALGNIVKHAGAGCVEVQLRLDAGAADTLVVAITDDGAGFDVAADHPGHLGLQCMAERVAQVGGTFAIDSAPGRTTVRARIPGAVQAPVATAVDEALAAASAEPARG